MTTWLLGIITGATFEFEKNILVFIAVFSIFLMMPFNPVYGGRVN